MAITWVLGKHVLDANDGSNYGVTHCELHPKFTNTSFYDDFDVAITTVNRVIEYSHNVKPICLPLLTAFHDFTGNMATVSGWYESNYLKYQTCRLTLEIPGADSVTKGLPNKPKF